MAPKAAPKVVRKTRAVVSDVTIPSLDGSTGYRDSLASKALFAAMGVSGALAIGWSQWCSSRRRDHPVVRAALDELVKNEVLRQHLGGEGAVASFIDAHRHDRHREKLTFVVTGPSGRATVYATGTHRQPQSTNTAPAPEGVKDAAGKVSKKEGGK